MATLADLMIKIGADSTGLSQELNKSKEALNQTFSVSPVKEFSGSVDEVAGKISGLTGNLTKLAGIAAGGFGLNAVVQSAVNAGEAVYQLGQRYSMSAAQAGQLNAVMKLTGGDVDTAAAAMMRFDKTLSSSGTAGDKARSIMQQLGISMTDSSGRLKPLNEQLGELAKGYEKAKAAGQGQEFLMNTLGVRGLALTKTLDNYTEAAERASKIKGVGLNPEEMHKAYMDMQEVNMQFGKLGVVAGSALAPLVSQILPSVQAGLAKVATLIAQNKTAISTVIVEGTKLLAIYKTLQMASKAVTAGKNMYNTARNVLGAGQKNGSTAQEEKQLDQLTKKQERYIQKSIADSDRMYQKRRKEAIKTAEQENMSAEETQKFLAEKFTQIGEEAAAAAEQIRSRMTAAYQQVNIAAQEAASGVQEANVRMAESSAQVAESEAATGVAAQEAAAVKQEANAAKITSNEEVIVANGEVADSEIAAGTAAEEGAVAKQEANAAKVASTNEVIAANEREKVVEVATGVEATNTGAKSVAANTAAQGGLAKTESKVKDVAKGHAVAGNTAVKAGKNTVGALGNVSKAAASAGNALLAMAGGWQSVAIMALYAAYCAWKYFHAKHEAQENNTWTGDGDYAGSTYIAKDGKIYKYVKKDPSAAMNDLYGSGSDMELKEVDMDSDEGRAVYAGIGSNPNSSIALFEKEQEAKKAMDDANKKAADINFDFPDPDIDTGGGGGSSSSGGSSSVATEKAAQPVEYDVPVGELAAYHAINDYWDGQQWRGKLGNDNDGWCDDFVHQIYKDVFDQLGKADPFGDGVVNDASFKALGAYHAGDLEAVRGALQVGDMVDTPGHVGIYIGNGMVRSRQSSAGVHDLSLDEFSNTFGGIQGYGSLAEATGGMTVKSSLVGKTAVNQAAAEAAKRLEKAKQDYAEILVSLEAATHKPDTAYEEGMLKIMDDVAKKRKKIQEIDKVGGVDTSQAKKLLGEYKAQQVKALNQKIKESNDELAADTAKVTAQMQGDYEAMYDAELKAAMSKLDKEKDARFKAVAKHKDDLDARIAVEEWYETKSLELAKKREKERRQEFDNSAKAAIEDLDTVRLYELTTSKKGTQDIYWDEKKKAMSTFYSEWRQANISTMGIANEAASAMESGLSNVFSDLGNNIQNVGKLAQNMGKVILDMIVKITAQWAAAKITMGLLGGFLGMGTTITNPSQGAWGIAMPSLTGAASGLSLDTGLSFLGADIPAFANGGRVTAPTLAMVGEGNDDEGIFPLNDDTYARMAQGIVNARGNNNGGNAPVVNIINNSSSQVSVKDSHYDGSMRRWILNAVVEDVNNNVDGSATNLKAALGVR